MNLRYGILPHLQGDGHRKAFVDITMESFSYQLGCWAATVTSQQPSNVQQILFHGHIFNWYNSAAMPNIRRTILHDIYLV